MDVEVPFRESKRMQHYVNEAKNSKHLQLTKSDQKMTKGTTKMHFWMFRDSLRYALWVWGKNFL